MNPSNYWLLVFVVLLLPVFVVLVVVMVFASAVVLVGSVEVFSDVLVVSVVLQEVLWCTLQPLWWQHAWCV